MDFSLTTLFVVPGAYASPSSEATQDLAAGELGVYNNVYTPIVVADLPLSAVPPYIYIAQGRENTYLQGSKRSDKISVDKIVEWYKTTGSAVAATQITEIGGFHVKCGEVVTITLRAHSSYIDTLYFNGFTRSITVQAPCCDCGEDPCTEVDVPALIDAAIIKFTEQAPGINPDNISFNTFYTFGRVGTDATAKLVIQGKPLTKYGQPCDVAAFPYEYDRMWFRAFVYKGPATTADFIVPDACDIVATSTVVQRASYPSGTSEEIAQLEKDYYSYQAGYLKHLYRMGGYNYNFESYVEAGITYDLFYIKFKPAKDQHTWGDYIVEDAMVIIAIPTGNSADFEAVLEGYLGTLDDNLSPATETTITPTTEVAPTTAPSTTLIP